MGIEWLPASAFKPRSDLVYVDTFNLHPIYEKIAFRGSHILVGPKGVAKSLSVQSFASKIEAPIITFDCSEDVRRSTLLGMFVLRGDQTPFVLGPLTTAFQIANEVGKCILVLEEINSLSPQMQKILNPVADFRRKIELPEAETVFQLDSKAQLWVVGTMNFSAYGGVYALNEDLKSRFRLIPISYPKKEHELAILKEVVTEKKLPKNFLNQLVLLAHETRQGAMDYALSTRDLVQITEDAQLLGVNTAIWISTGKFEGDDVEAYKRRITSIFEEVTFPETNHEFPSQ